MYCKQVSLIVRQNLILQNHNPEILIDFVKKFLDLNSSTGYPDKEHPITEYEYFDGEPYISYYNYGWMRRYREKLMEHTSHLCDMHIGIARGTAIFGPHDNFDLESCHVVPALIKRHLSGEDPFVVWGSPDVVRDFLYVKDVVDGALLILQEGVSMRPYNLGYGSTITIGDIVNSIFKITGKAPEVDGTNQNQQQFHFVRVQRKELKLNWVLNQNILLKRV